MGKLVSMYIARLVQSGQKDASLIQEGFNHKKWKKSIGASSDLVVSGDCCHVINKNSRVKCVPCTMCAHVFACVCLCVCMHAFLLYACIPVVSHFPLNVNLICAVMLQRGYCATHSSVCGQPSWRVAAGGRARRVSIWIPQAGYWTEGAVPEMNESKELECEMWMRRMDDKWMRCNRGGWMGARAWEWEMWDGGVGVT